ncbi:MAG: peptide-methionine (S)-S-oxide reductase, partial [Cyclobacteriaceae bacterium]|nr:peptide-methionine (S)-S-oxide reductase [Cyclobacteriaceae bacterium]
QKVLEIFWITHDPTTINRQGHDIGTQYRSVIFYHTTIQKEIAEYLKQEIQTLEVYDSPVITEITKASEFYKAESYHQNYYKFNGDQPYCQYVIKPKLDKFRDIFNDFIN